MILCHKLTVQKKKIIVIDLITLLVLLSLKTEAFERDQFFWKFNDSLLRVKTYVNEIKKLKPRFFCFKMSKNSLALITWIRIKMN